MEQNMIYDNMMISIQGPWGTTSELLFRISYPMVLQMVLFNLFKADPEQSQIGYFFLEKTYFPTYLRNMF